MESCVIIDQILVIHALKNIEETCNQHRPYATVWKRKTFTFDFSPSSTKILFLSRMFTLTQWKIIWKFLIHCFDSFGCEVFLKWIVKHSGVLILSKPTFLHNFDNFTTISLKYDAATLVVSFITFCFCILFR